MGIDPGDIRHAICVLTPDGTIIEVGDSRPWISRLFREEGWVFLIEPSLLCLYVENTVLSAILSR